MAVLEKPCRFSTSMLWRLQADYYERKGLAAWGDGAVPFRISSNPFIAHAYAEILSAFWRDCGDPRPLTVVELGGGSGRFGFLTARALAALADEGVRFRYILTDAARSNVLAWADHPRMAPLIAAGLVDFAVMDAAGPDRAKLLIADQPLAEAMDGGPVAVVANYLLDVLVHDAFRVEGGVLHEVRVGLDVEDEGADLSDPAALLPKIKFRQEKHPVDPPYYGDPVWDKILDDYRRELKAATFLMPVAGLAGLDALKRMAGGRLLLLVSDKARIDDAQMERRDGLSLVLDGSYAATVNLNAYARWIKAQGGVAITRSARNSRFDTYAFAIGAGGGAAETARAFRRQAETFAPVDYNTLIYGVRRKLAERDPSALLAAIRLGRFDPELVAYLERPLVRFVAKAGSEERAGLAEALDRAWANHFFIGGKRDPGFSFGRLYRRLGRTEQAIACYRASLAELGPSVATHRNMGRCFEILGDTGKAVAHYREAMALGGDETTKRALVRLGAASDPVQ